MYLHMHITPLVKIEVTILLSTYVLIIIIMVIRMLGLQRPVATISFAGNVHVRLQDPIGGGWRLRVINRFKHVLYCYTVLCRV